MDNNAPCNVYNIGVDCAFSKTLARYVLHKTKAKPELLTRYKILLPTRRACRILRETFLSLNNGAPTLLPQMVPIGDVDEDELSLMMFGKAGGALDVPQAIAPLRRQLLLAKLVRAADGFTQGPDHALALAAALCRFIDQVTVEGLDFVDLHRIVPDEFAAHWKITLDFLQIISKNWPIILAEHGVIDAAKRRNILLHALADHWRDCPPDYPVIAAGSTGSIPAAADLLSVVARMDGGEIILPGVDLGMDNQSWDLVEENHPQYGLKTMLDRINVDRDDVTKLDFPNYERRSTSREILAREMMLPAQMTVQWKDFKERHDIAPMLKNLQYFSCDTQQEEAQLIALIMREALQQSNKVTALITPDRTLARRVAALCRRWNIEVDDSAGLKLNESDTGKLALSCIALISHNFDPVAFLTLLKMPLCLMGEEREYYHKIISILECDYLRQGKIISSFDVLRTEIIDSGGNDNILNFLDKFCTALEPLFSLISMEEKNSFSTILKAHLNALEALANTPDKSGAQILWRGDDGEAAASFFAEILQQASLIGDVSFDDYSKILRALMRGVTIRSAYGVHPRLLILGQIEARLSDADLIIMGGLNEGIWPADAGHDPWMSRPMRKSFGLPASEQAIGLAAHDFVQGFCAQKVIMTRSKKIDGSPSVRSRWLERLDTLMQSCGHDIDELSNSPYLFLVKMLDDNDVFTPCERPKPKPPLSARPKRASVTKIDVWLQNPYAIYMYYVLKLRPIKPLVRDNDAAMRGTILHEILERFTKVYPLELPQDAQGQLVIIARDVLKKHLPSEDTMHYWWPRFLKIAQWFVAHEKNWRMDAKFFESEIIGNIDIDIDGEMFNLSGTADRVDRMHGGYGIIDYKTGGTFTSSKLKSGRLPQLPLEALILARGGFTGSGGGAKEVKKAIPSGEVKYLGYWKMTGGKISGETRAIEGDLDETIEIVLDGLKDLIAAFREIDIPFYAVPDTQNAPRFNDYEHLSRLKEWAALDDSTDGEAA